MKPRPRARRNIIGGGHSETFISIVGLAAESPDAAWTIGPPAIHSLGRGWNGKGVGCDKLKCLECSACLGVHENRLMILLISRSF